MPTPVPMTKCNSGSEKPNIVCSVIRIVAAAITWATYISRDNTPQSLAKANFGERLIKIAKATVATMPAMAHPSRKIAGWWTLCVATPIVTATYPPIQIARRDGLRNSASRTKIELRATATPAPK